VAKEANTYMDFATHSSLETISMNAILKARLHSGGRAVNVTHVPTTPGLN
jgi:hypothetical protein